MPDMPQPSSIHVEFDDSRPDVNRTLVGEAIHSANRGVTAQTTAHVLVTYLRSTSINDTEQ